MVFYFVIQRSKIEFVRYLALGGTEIGNSHLGASVQLCNNFGNTHKSQFVGAGVNNAVITKLLGYVVDLVGLYVGGSRGVIHTDIAKLKIIQGL